MLEWDAVLKHKAEGLYILLACNYSNSGQIFQEDYLEPNSINKLKSAHLCHAEYTVRSVLRYM